jgi:ribosome biogenesis protein BMS1
MMTTWQLRKKFEMKTPNHRDSYKPIERVEKAFTPIIVPKKLEEILPLKTKDKIKTQSLKEKIQREERSLLKPLASEQEKKAIYLVQRLKLIEKERKNEKAEKLKEKLRIKQKWEDGMKKDRNLAVKKLRKEKFVKQGIREKRKAEGQGSKSKGNRDNDD